MDSFIRDNGKIERNDVNVNRLDAMVSAMWELLIEKGYTREELNAKLDKVKEQKLTLDPQRTKVICPVCGKTVSDIPSLPFEGKCIYCGHTMMIYPGDSILSEKDSEPLPDNDPSDPDRQDQL